MLYLLDANILSDSKNLMGVFGPGAGVRTSANPLAKPRRNPQDSHHTELSDGFKAMRKVDIVYCAQ